MTMTDPALRQALSSMEAELDQIAVTQQDMAIVQQLNLDPYRIRTVNLGPILGPYLGLTDLGVASDVGWEFVTGPEFRNLTLFKLDLMVGAQDTMKSAESELRGLSALIARQLGTAVE